ncbi:hypothetical protein C7M84_010996, partial [Penaeus vannamei]
MQSIHPPRLTPANCFSRSPTRTCSYPLLCPLSLAHSLSRARIHSLSPSLFLFSLSHSLRVRTRTFFFHSHPLLSHRSSPISTSYARPSKLLSSFSPISLPSHIPARPAHYQPRLLTSSPLSLSPLSLSSLSLLLSFLSLTSSSLISLYSSPFRNPPLHTPPTLSRNSPSSVAPYPTLSHRPQCHFLRSPPPTLVTPHLPAQPLRSRPLAFSRPHITPLHTSHFPRHSAQRFFHTLLDPCSPLLSLSLSPLPPHTRPFVNPLLPALLPLMPARAPSLPIHTLSPLRVPFSRLSHPTRTRILPTLPSTPSHCGPVPHPARPPTRTPQTIRRFHATEIPSSPFPSSSCLLLSVLSVCLLAFFLLAVPPFSPSSFCPLPHFSLSFSLLFLFLSLSLSLL